MTWKDLLLQAGVIVTLLLGVVNLIFTLRTARRTSFVNTVTAERVKWIAKVRDNVAILCSLCDRWMFHPEQAKMADLQRQIEAKRVEIRLQLNPNDSGDTEIASLLDQLPTWTQSMSPDSYRALQAQLVAATQAMLKREWDKVKTEAVKGDLRARKPA